MKNLLTTLSILFFFLFGEITDKPAEKNSQVKTASQNQPLKPFELTVDDADYSMAFSLPWTL